MKVTIAGREIDTSAPRPTIGEAPPKQLQLAVNATAGRISVVNNRTGRILIEMPRTIDNIEEIADALSAGGYPAAAEEVRRAKYWRR